jgi:aarF domain-containing kinase
MRQWVMLRFGFGGQREGFEDELERSMRGFTKNNLGFEVAPNAFEG